ncbi:hypothetical protein SLEP1_g21274 [Rubroshorea leprosula]|uniref:DUF4220 domain-containing protein n=1 Tax=Rubroshorea leprosula TaxID=152421 RepID=A0AAV5J5F6_9ROSI|nr:hypothetical protein SLEP1_g21274 [Rubroshorea leprosula]
MVLLSLLLQFVLLWVGHRRRKQGKCSHYVAIFAWFSYVSADWVTTVALSALLKAKVKELTNELVVFWTPFLLLHLGGPHTISAYALTDNELWLRSFLGLVIQVGVAMYAYVKFGTNNTLRYSAIPMFITGIIKYVERIWILRDASYKQFSNSVFSSTSSNTLDTTQTSDSTCNHHPQTLDEFLRDKNVIEEGKSFYKAYYLYKMYIPLFSELRLRIYRNLRDKFMLPYTISAEDAFKIVQIELEFLCDKLYTKSIILQSTKGVILQGICFLSTFAAVITFSITVGNYHYPREDICITYLLLGGAIFVDICSAISHAFSDWTIYRLSSPTNSVHKFVGYSIASWLVRCKAKKKGITYMAQHSLIDYCLKVKTSSWSSILRVPDIEEFREKFCHTSWEKVDSNLKKFILSHLQQKFKRYQNIKDEASGEKIDKSFEEFDHLFLIKMLNERGDHVLQRMEIPLKDEFKWSILDVEFGHSILLWHIATFLLFYDDHRRYSSSVLGLHCRISKLLSDYMMYLLMARPLMLPKGIGQVRIRDTQTEVITFLAQEKSLNNNDVASALLDRQNKFPPPLIHSKSVLKDGCRLASMLKALVEELLWDPEEKWEMIANVWMEMLVFAASKCRWKHHETHLRHGGELLTHVALLMAHLGLTEHIRIVQKPSAEVQSLKWDWERHSHMSDYLA